MADMNVQQDSQSNPSPQVTIESSRWERIAGDTPARTTYHIEGACPKCTHHTFWNVYKATVFGFRFAKTTQQSGSTTPIDVSCICNQCKEPVEGKNRTGCGWHAPIVLKT